MYGSSYSVIWVLQVIIFGTLKPKKTMCTQSMFSEIHQTNQHKLLMLSTNHTWSPSQPYTFTKPFPSAEVSQWWKATCVVPLISNNLAVFSHTTRIVVFFYIKYGVELLGTIITIYFMTQDSRVNDTSCGICQIHNRTWTYLSRGNLV